MTQRGNRGERGLGFRRYLLVSTCLVAATLMAAPLVSAAALTSVVTDPVGDAVLTPGIAGPSYQDIVEASITLSHGQFIFTMDLAAPIPNSPPLLPPGTALIDWAWHLNTEPTQAPCGFPLAPATCFPFEFAIVIVWAGTSFTGILIDRRPLLTEGNAIVTAVPFTIQGTEVTASVSGAMIGNPSSFLWTAVTAAWSAGFGTDSFHPVDLAPDNSGFAAPWPG